MAAGAAAAHFYPLYVCTGDGHLLEHQLYPHSSAHRAEVYAHAAALDGVVLRACALPCLSFLHAHG